MAKAKYAGPADRLELYEQLIETVPDVDRKGAANPYTSRNGYMTSFIDKEGEVSLRLDKESIEEFITEFDSRTSTQYGKQMRDFVVVPDDLLERTDDLQPWFVRSWEHTGSLPPK